MGSVWRELRASRINIDVSGLSGTVHRSRLIARCMADFGGSEAEALCTL